MEPELEQEHGAVKRAATRAERQRRSWGKDAEWVISCNVPAATAIIQAAMIQKSKS